MKKSGKSTAKAEPEDDWEEDSDSDSDSDRSDLYSDYPDDDSTSIDDVPEMIDMANKRRIDARRAIERLREQIELNNDLQDYNDFLV